jgi:hypothetical protein
VAELVDAADSKSAVRKDVLVRFQSRAREEKTLMFNVFFVYISSNFILHVVIKIATMSWLDHKNKLLDIFSYEFGNRGNDLFQYCLDNGIEHFAYIKAEFDSIQNDLYRYIDKITPHNKQLTPIEIQAKAAEYCKMKYNWINDSGIEALNRWLIWMCWHEGILKY